MVKTGSWLDGIGCIISCLTPPPNIFQAFRGTWSRNSSKVTIKVVFPSGEIQTIEISRKMRVDKLIADASQTLIGTSGHCPTDIMALHSKDGRLDGVVMHGNRSIGSYNIKDGHSIILQVRQPQLHRKPVIYLYSPSDIDVSVKLSLIPEWSL
ncbi:hypothetical protein F4604DRAFT_1895092, partial [Suillus subluteus]